MLLQSFDKAELDIEVRYAAEKIKNLANSWFLNLELLNQPINTAELKNDLHTVSVLMERLERYLKTGESNNYGSNPPSLKPFNTFGAGGSGHKQHPPFAIGGNGNREM